MWQNPLFLFAELMLNKFNQLNYTTPTEPELVRLRAVLNRKEPFKYNRGISTYHLVPSVIGP